MFDDDLQCPIAYTILQGSEKVRGLFRSRSILRTPEVCMKVLLVDDDELVRTVLAEILDNAGHEVVDTGDPLDALGLPDAQVPRTC